jgi:hypothetical protein
MASAVTLATFLSHPERLFAEDANGNSKVSRVLVGTARSARIDPARLDRKPGGMLDKSQSGVVLTRRLDYLNADANGSNPCSRTRRVPGAKDRKCG